MYRRWRPWLPCWLQSSKSVHQRVNCSRSQGFGRTISLVSRLPQNWGAVICSQQGKAQTMRSLQPGVEYSRRVTQQRSIERYLVPLPCEQPAQKYGASRGMAPRV